MLDDDNTLVLPVDSIGAKLFNGIYTTEQLLRKAETGERLCAEDRRACLSYLMQFRAGMSNVQLGSFFSVSESCIRKDKQLIEQTRVRETFDEDVSLVVFRTIDLYDRQIRALENSKNDCTLGTRDYVFHCKALAELAEKKLKTLQDLGYIAPVVNTSDETAFNYAAIVQKDNIETRPVNMFDDVTQSKLKANSSSPENAKPISTREVVFVKSDHSPNQSD